jgi:predicted acyltransferase
MIGGDPADPLSKLGNIGTRLDLAVIGRAHLYRKDGGFDPEGLLGCVPAIINVLAGYWAARFILDNPDRRVAMVWRMAMTGIGLTALGLFWGRYFPITKKLWTSSYVLLTIGLDLLVLAALIGLIELGGRRLGVRFFQIFGQNPLVIYLFSELFVTTLGLIQVAPGMGLYDWLGRTVFQTLAPGAFGSLLCAIAYTLVCWLLAFALHRRGIIVKI